CPGSAQLAVAVLVLLAAAAGAGIVAADLRLLAHDGAAGLGAGERRDLVLGAVALLPGVLELGLAQLGLGLGPLLGFQRGDLLLAADADPRQQADDLALDVVQHLREQLEGLALVLLLGL